VGQDTDTDTDTDMDMEVYTDLPEITYALRVRAEPVFVRPKGVLSGGGVSTGGGGESAKGLDVQSQITTGTELITSGPEHVVLRGGRLGLSSAEVRLHEEGGKEQCQPQQQQRWPPTNPKPDSEQRRPRLTLPLRLPSTRRAPVGSRVFPMGGGGGTIQVPVLAPAPAPAPAPVPVRVQAQAQVPDLAFSTYATTTKSHPHPHPQQDQDQDQENTRTPNVYINGLPPQYPESELYTLTCTYGQVKSVRTFTRHVCGRAS
jgi:hypothetical protein